MSVEDTEEEAEVWDLAQWIEVAGAVGVAGARAAEAKVKGTLVAAIPLSVAEAFHREAILQ